jgi:preprotein translocase subunit YajC
MLAESLFPGWFLLGQQEGAAPWYVNVFPFALIALMFYLLMIRPEQRKRAQLTQMLSNLKKNDHVITVGGIHGVVVNTAKESDEVTIRVDENTNTRLRVSRSAISRVVSEGEESKESE